MACIRLGTCSWNYDSWLGLVYSEPRKRAVEYLPEYSEKYQTAEIDSWFYKIPAISEAVEYLASVPEDFRFTCKVYEGISLTHLRSRGRDGPLRINEDFLSPRLFAQFVSAIEPLLGRLDAIMLEFEYLNREKMPSLDEFLKRLASFRREIGADIPLAVETRNANYLTEEYFAFLDQEGLLPVFSEKLYLPHVYEVYERNKRYINRDVVIRLLGGDRKAIEKKTGERWDAIVEEKPDKRDIVRMSLDIQQRGHGVTISVNNHYEGSAPLSIGEFRRLFAEATG